MSEFNDGDRVWYDLAAGTVVKRTIDGPSGVPMYLVKWAGGDRTTIVWGSDLVAHAEKGSGRPGAPKGM